MGKRPMDARLAAAVTEINNSIVAIKCEVCGECCGFIELMALSDPSDAPAAYCSPKCIRLQAERNIA